MPSTVASLARLADAVDALLADPMFYTSNGETLRELKRALLQAKGARPYPPPAPPPGRVIKGA